VVFSESQQVKLSLYRLPESFGHSSYECGKVVSPTHRSPLLARRYPRYFLLEAESAAGKVKSVKNLSDDLVGN
jgi:hypothetical protein